METERDWYSESWKILRTQLLKLCLSHSDPLLQAIKVPNCQLTELTISYIEQVTMDITNRIPQDQIGLWKHCLPILAQPEWLCKELECDRSALLGEKKSTHSKVTPKQALGRKLWQFFEKNRRDFIADQLGVSSNRIKTWERLDRISRSIKSEEELSGRCTEEHFKTLAAHIKQNHAKDKNLPRRAKTVKGYFYRFSRDCIEHIEDTDFTMDRFSLQQAKELMGEVGMKELSQCLERLSDVDIALIDTAFQLQFGKISYLSMEQYCNSNDITKKQFKKKRMEIIHILRDCLELSLAQKQGGLR